MGWFSKKPKESNDGVSTGVAPTSTTTPWRLRGGWSHQFKADPTWVEEIQASVEKTPRVGHNVTVELKRNRQGIVEVFYGDRVVGALDTAESKQYSSAFSALERTKRHGLVDATVRMKGSKAQGESAWFDLCRPDWPCVPFNEPPIGIPRAGSYNEFIVKDENKFSDFIKVILRGMNASPGWFVIDVADESGLHPVWAPVTGKTPKQSQVGYVSKAGTKQAAALTEGGPVWLPGVVFWRSTTPQVELASWQG